MELPRARGFPHRRLYGSGFGCSCTARSYCRSGAHPRSPPSCPLYPQGLAIEGLLESLAHCCQGLRAAFNLRYLQAASGGHSTGEFQIFFLQGLDSGSFSLSAENIPEGQERKVSRRYGARLREASPSNSPGLEFGFYLSTSRPWPRACFDSHQHTQMAVPL